MNVFRRLWSLWAVRSMAVGAVCTGLDLLIAQSIVLAAPDQARAAAMTGTLIGSAVSFFGNRRFAFKASDDNLGESAVRYLIMWTTLWLIHGQVVVLLKPGYEVWFEQTLKLSKDLAFAASKLSADVLVFSVVQLLLLRYFVFRRKTGAPAAEREESRGAA